MMAAPAILPGTGVPGPAIGHLTAPSLVLREPAVAGMPTGDRQEIRVLAATFGPGDRTVFHSHRWPVTVYVLEGHFTLQIGEQPAIVVGPGQAFVESPDVLHTGSNQSATDDLRVVIFYVSAPETPFLDPAP